MLCSLLVDQRGPRAHQHKMLCTSRCEERAPGSGSNPGARSGLELKLHGVALVERGVDGVVEKPRQLLVDEHHLRDAVGASEVLHAVEAIEALVDRFQRSCGFFVSIVEVLLS